MRRLRLIPVALWMLVGVVGAALVGLSGWVPILSPQPPTAISRGVAAVGGPFSLTSHKGEQVDNSRLAGKPYLLFFGFTYCPDVCPTTLLELSEVLRELGTDAGRLQVVFVSVDPERDTQEQLADYVRAFDERIVALRGTQAETDATVKAFAAYARKVPQGATYTMDHTASVYMMSASGNFVGTIDMHEPSATRLQKVRRLLDRRD